MLKTFFTLVPILHFNGSEPQFFGKMVGKFFCLFSSSLMQHPLLSVDWLSIFVNQHPIRGIAVLPMFNFNIH